MRTMLRHQGRLLQGGDHLENRAGRDGRAMRFASPVAAKTVLKASSCLPPKHTFPSAIEARCKEFEARTNGELEVCPAGQRGPLNVNRKNKEPSSREALKGLRIRHTGAVFQQLIDRFGGAPMPVPPAEISWARAKGIIDGATFPFKALAAFDLGPGLKYSMGPGAASAILPL